MSNDKDVHLQFAKFFGNEALEPFAWLVSKGLQGGHVCVDPNSVVPDEEEGLPYPLDRFSASDEVLKNLPNYIAVNERAAKPFIYFNKKLYLQRYFNYETNIIECIKRFIEKEKNLRSSREEQIKSQAEFLKSLNVNIGDQNLSEWEKPDYQLAAAILAYINNFTIITGGPGTGKTTTVAKILSLLYRENNNIKAAIAAPTGKASMRVMESLKENDLIKNGGLKDKINNLEAKTIHRLLGYIPGSLYFSHNSENYLDYDVIIIDEASMIDAALFSKLISAVNPESRLIILGDCNQLASIEAGSLFGDLCKSIMNSEGQSAANIFSDDTLSFINTFIADKHCHIPDEQNKNYKSTLTGHIIELKRSFRFHGQGEIGKFSTAVINNEPEKVQEFISGKNETVQIDEEYDDNIFLRFVDGYAAYINETDIAEALKKLNKLRVLCAIKEGKRGLYLINKKIEAHLAKKKLIHPKSEFYNNRPILITKNYKDLKLFNGDTGIIRKDADENYKAYFLDADQQVRAVSPGFISESETVFAMTIHKSQGSEYDSVMIILPENEKNPLLTRELLYTAVTRAKKNVIIQGKNNVIIKSVMSGIKRSSGIADRFQN